MSHKWEPEDVEDLRREIEAKGGVPCPNGACDYGAVEADVVRGPKHRAYIDMERVPCPTCLGAEVVPAVIGVA